jgi:hypothetical protein
MFKVYNSDGSVDTETSASLQNHLNTTSFVQSDGFVIAEWNLNIAENINTVGNYYHNPNGTVAASRFVQETELTTNPTWFGATDARIVNNGSVYDSSVKDVVPQSFISSKQKTQYLFSLQDCFGKFRPRSGINKAVYFPKRQINYGVGNPDQTKPIVGASAEYANRPRYYMPDMNDQFKYWSSYRATVDETGQTPVATERGISTTKNNTDNGYYIQDAAPFVAYGEKMATNRVVIKMQTNSSDVDLTESLGFADPFYGYGNSTTPVTWKVQYLDPADADVDGNLAWKTLWTSPTGFQVPSDGNVELAYGFSVPSDFRNSFNYAGKYSNAAYLPVVSVNGYAYLVEATSNAGKFYIWSDADSTYHQYDATPTWFVNDPTFTNSTPLVTQTVGTNADSPDPSGRVENFPQYKDVSGVTHYREFQYINGLRIVVDTMNIQDCSFDLIELSARLTVDLTDKTTDLSLKKSSSDLNQTGLPVGQLLVSTGSLTLFDYDKAFSDNNEYSIISQFSMNSRYKPIRKMRVKPPKKSKSSASYIQIKAFDVLRNINNQDYYVPVKTMYVDGFPEIGAPNRSVTINLRDLYFYFESMTAPQLFIPECSLSFAITTLMDSIGFTNYKFKKTPDEKDPVIPFFFVAPNTTVAQVLNDLAVSFQAAMFLDESNDLIIMYKNYLLPSLNDRETDLVLYGSDDSNTNGVIKNSTTYDISAISNNGSYVTYTCNNNFVVGKHVTIFGATSSAYNIVDAVVTEATGTYFKVASTATGTTSTAKVKISPALANIIDIKTEQDRVFNDGKITFSSRYIQKSLPTVRSVSLDSRDVNWYYKPVLLWEIAPPQSTKPANEQVGTQQGYALTALALNADISENAPSVEASTSDPSVHTLVNNTIDFGESVSWMPRYNGYFYANGEIIRYDAVEYSVTGIENVWITSPQEYQKYFAKVPFGGKIYPTGRVRIYAEPYYELMFDAYGNPIYGTDNVQKVRLKLGPVAKHGRGQFGTSIVAHSFGINSEWTNPNNIYGCLMDSSYIVNPDNFSISKDKQPTFTEVAGKGNTVDGLKTYDKFARTSKITGTIKNILSANNTPETPANNTNSATPGNVQASALIFSGAKPTAKLGTEAFAKNPMDFISYIIKNLDNDYRHVGSRMRIIGEVKENKDNTAVVSQTPVGSVTYYSGVGASSGGIAVGVNPNTNHGYYFEIAALTDATINTKATGKTLNNVFFYKIGKDNTKIHPGATINNQTPAIPQLLWTGLTNILVDDGNFVGQNRRSGDSQVTVYDLAVEHEPYIDSTGGFAGIKFYLYINDKLVGTAVDQYPVTQTLSSTIALFVRGNAKMMFENVYAVTQNYADGDSSKMLSPAQAALTQSKGSFTNASFRKYTASQSIQNTYMSGLHPSGSPAYSLYFEEFGTIMREAAYINAQYDKAYPALTARISPTFNDIQGYVVAGFTASAYSAEFLIINTTDTVLVLDDSSGNFLRIQGVTFTQESQNQLTVDDYFGKKTNFSDTTLINDSSKDSPYGANATYADIKNSQMTYGKNAFTLDAKYVQSQDAANELMEWLTSKVLQPRIAVGLSLYGNPTIQLGDVVEVQYNVPNEIAIDGTRFVVYAIQYDRTPDGPTMIVYLSEVTA